MTWFTHPNGPLFPGEKLEKLYSGPDIVRVPGTHNALAALLAKEAGFEALYLSGGALSSSLGLPDLGVMTMEELLLFVRVICRSSKLPLIVDGDTGYGEALNVMRLVQDLEEAGAAAVQIEDQILPKKCGHLSDKLLNTPEAMARKISAARKARKHLRIIARTDAAASEGFDSALERAKLYVDAGADIIFPEALTSKDQMRKFNDSIGVPTLANMTEFGRTPYLTGEEFKDLGFSIVIWPVTSLRCEALAMQELYSHLYQHDGQEGYLNKLMKREEIYKSISYHDYEALDQTISKSVVPAVK
jgi:methylisocitrate lyase